ncbi:chorismate-binding protein [Sinomonas halotolerans]|uniref:Chorismate-binding protein n=1 Tax=Sinomonas halotolerans TaxID=1644133 RepID=A0ABU9X1Z2_9MICC
MAATHFGSARTPAVIAVDGRSGAGKTSLAVELAAALRAHRNVALLHLEDVYPGWDGLAAGIDACAARLLGPLRRGETARWRPWDWAAGAEGPERESEPADVVILEGVGAGAAPLREFSDAVVWVEAPAAERKRRALARDGETYAPFWEQWAAQEDAWLAADDVPAAADVTVGGPRAGGPDGEGGGHGGPRPEGVAPRVLAALAELPALREALAPERAEREAVGVLARRIACRPNPEELFAGLFGASGHAVWLDSSDAEMGGLSSEMGDLTGEMGGLASEMGVLTAEMGVRSRFSIMADDGGQLGRRMAHRRGATEVVFGPGTEVPAAARFQSPFFRWLDSAWVQDGPAAVPGLQCGFALGWLGYLGYELKRECGGNDVDPGLPDAQLVFASRAVVLDHGQGEAWLLALDAPGASEWLDDAATIVAGSQETPISAAHTPISAAHTPISAAHTPTSAVQPPTSAAHTPTSAGTGLGARPAFASRDSAAGYMDKVRASQAEIAEGNTYEVCLTTALEATVPSADPLAAYRALRRRSPAPFAAFARFGPLAVASTSPERFLAVTADGSLRAEPIKGTRRRRADASTEEDAAVVRELAANPKDRAENLMIVDLLRNDLSHHAVPGSVRVSRLFAVESYATVHQLVSTIDARLRPGASRAEAVAAAFPPGSMTGAPKISTMDILDRLEAGPRGVYSGAIGYFSRTGAADLSVVIRTLVMAGPAEAAPGEQTGGAHDGGTRLTLGVGGAVVADSDPADEYEEIRTKAFGVLSALGADFPD